MCSAHGVCTSCKPYGTSAVALKSSVPGTNGRKRPPLAVENISAYMSLSTALVSFGIFNYCSTLPSRNRKHAVSVPLSQRGPTAAAAQAMPKSTVNNRALHGMRDPYEHGVRIRTGSGSG